MARCTATTAHGVADHYRRAPTKLAATRRAAPTARTTARPGRPTGTTFREVADHYGDLGQPKQPVGASSAVWLRKTDGTPVSGISAARRSGYYCWLRDFTSRAVDQAKAAAKDGRLPLGQRTPTSTRPAPAAPGVRLSPAELRNASSEILRRARAQRHRPGNARPQQHTGTVPPHLRVPKGREWLTGADGPMITLN